MLGAMAAQPKVRKVAQRQQQTKLGVLEKPKEIQNVRTEDKQVRNSLCIEPVHARRTAPCLGSQAWLPRSLFKRVRSPRKGQRWKKNKTCVTIYKNALYIWSC